MTFPGHYRKQCKNKCLSVQYRVETSPVTWRVAKECMHPTHGLTPSDIRPGFASGHTQLGSDSHETASGQSSEATVQDRGHKGQEASRSDLGRAALSKDSLRAQKNLQGGGMGSFLASPHVTTKLSHFTCSANSFFLAYDCLVTCDCSVRKTLCSFQEEKNKAETLLEDAQMQGLCRLCRACRL